MLCHTHVSEPMNRVAGRSVEFFLTSSHQLKNGINNDYTEDEIREAVIKAINLALSPRNSLEGKADLTLAKLRRIIHSHYQERTATELYHQLSSTVQQPNEKSQEFLICLLDLKQKVLFVSQKTWRRKLSVMKSYSRN